MASICCALRQDLVISIPRGNLPPLQQAAQILALRVLPWKAE
jgi:hypothetical protein